MYTVQQNPPKMGGDPTDRNRVYIDNSLLVNRSGHSIGKGLFARCFIPTGTTICSYWGKIIKTSKAKSADYVSDYVLQCSNDWLIDAKSKLSCYGRYCNDPILPTKLNAELIGSDTDGNKDGVIGQREISR